MANIFEELMFKHQELSDETLQESVRRKSAKTEAKKINFKKLRVESFKIFEEEDFDKLDQEFATDVDDEKADEDEVVLVIDPELPPEEEVPEDAAQQLVGDYVYKCPVCGANYVCGCDAAETEAIEVDENGVPTECPVCGDDSEQILVGEIAPVEDVEKTEDEEEMEPVDNEEDIEEFEEDEDKVIEDSLKRRPLLCRRIKTESKKSSRRGRKLKESFEEGDYIRYKSGVNDLFTPDQLYQVEYFEDGYMYYSPINRAASKALAKWNEENDADPDDFGFVEVEVADDQFDKAELESKKSSRRGRKLKEDFDEDDTTFSDDIELVEPECPECEVEPEVVEEVEEKTEEAPKVEVNADKVEIVLDDVRFNKLIGQMISENYQGKPLFKLTKVKSSKNTLTLEYVVRNGKKNLKGQFVAEGFNTKSRTMKLRMRDKGVFTESLTKVPAFIVECVRIRNKIVPTSIKYNFVKKVNESLYRVKGEVKNSK